MVDNSGQHNTGFQSASGQPQPTFVSNGLNSSQPTQYQAQFVQTPVAQPMVGAPAVPSQNYQPTPAPQPATPTPDPEDEEPRAETKRRIGLPLSKAGKRIALYIATFLVFMGLGVGVYIWWQASRGEPVSDTPVSSALTFDIQDLPLDELSPGSLPTLQGSRKLSINGLLEVKDSMVIAPSGQPTGAVAGQLYYDQDTNILNYFNGTEFIAVGAATQTVNDIGGASGSIAVGTGLSVVAGQLSNAGVVSLQASGALTSSGGQNPNVSFADGTAAGQFWQWDGDSWELASLPTSETPGVGDGDSVIGNEVTDVIVGGGLILRGSATAADPLKVGLETCALDEVLKSNGSGGWVCSTDAGGVSYGAGNGLNLNSGQFSVNSPTCGGTDKLQWNGTGFVCATDIDTDTNTTYSAGTGLNLVGTTFNNSGVLNVTASGPITSSGGQTPNLTFANGTLNGQFWQWNGSAWALATLQAEQDSVVGNEVLNATANQGLVRSGSGTALDPFTLGLQSCSDGQILKRSGSNWVCAAEGTGGGTNYDADGEGIELIGTTFSLELDSTSLAKSASGLALNTANANNWSATQTFGAGLVVTAGQSISVNGDVITDMTGTGLTVAGGSLQTTLGVSVDLGSEVVGTLPIANGGTGLTALGTAHQLLGVNSAGTALEYKNIGSLISGGTGISVSGTNVVTVSNSGVLSVAGSGPITSTGGQTPSLTFAAGTTNGQFWQWNGSAWALASLPAEQDAVIGNEVTGGTGSNSGLTRSGTGTAGNPYTLAVTTGNGLQVTSNAVAINSPTCSGTTKLQWNGTAFVCATDVDTDTNTTYSTISNGGLRLVGTQFGLGICSENQILKATSVAGEYACANDSDSDTNTMYTADGQGIELTGTVFSLELNGTSLSKGVSGLALNLANANTWTGAQTFNAGATVGTGQSLTVNGDAFTDLTGTGLTINTGSLQTTLGTSVDLTTEVVGTLPVGNGGTGLTALGTSNQLLGVNAGGTSLEYKNLSSILSGGTGISLSGTNSVTVNNTGVLSVATSGPITTTGGQTPTLTFANGDTPGQFWQWDGDSWELASLPAEQDAVVGNEVTNVTGSNSGLVRSGSGTGVSPYTLAVNTGNGLQITSNALGINSPTCSNAQKLLWTGTAFTCAADSDSDTNTTYSAYPNGGLRLVGTQFGLSVCDPGQVLKATAVAGEYECADDADINPSYSADGQGIELTGTTFGLELDGASLSKSATGLKLNVANANTWTGAQTFNAGATIGTGQTLTVNGDAFTDLTGTGLTINTGSLQTTLGTSVDLTSEVVGTLPVGNGGTGLTALGTSNQLLGVNAGGTSLEYKNLSSLLSGGTGVSLSGTSSVTVNNTGVLSVGSSSTVTSSGGQNPTLSFADGTANEQIWMWDGDSWELTLLPDEQDAVVGNEVTNVTGSNSGLVRSGSGTGGSPYTLAVNPGNGLQITSNALGINSQTCNGTDKLQWTGTAFICSPDVDNDTDTNTTYTALANGGLRLVSTQFGLGVCSQNQIFKATSVSGEWACAADNDTNTTYTADGQGIELTGTTFSLELNGTTLNKTSSGLAINLGNVNTWTGVQTFNAGATVGTGQTFTVNGDAFTDLTGTGLALSSGALTATLGTSVDLASEVTGTLPVANGGTGLTSLGTAGQILNVNGGATGLQYSSMASFLTAGTGIGLSGTTNVTISNGGVLSVAGSGAITSSGGQSPTISFVNGSTNGQFWQWNGSSWNLSTDIGTVVTCNVGGNFACINGNTKGANVTLGTNDAQSLILETNNTAVATITSTGKTTFKTNTDSTDGFNIVDSGNFTTFSVDTINNRIGVNQTNPQTALDVSGAIQQTGMATTTTGSSNNNKWTKLGTCTLTAQYQMCNTSISIIGGNPGTAGGNSQAYVSARVKQQNAMGGVPYVNVTVNNEAKNLTASNFRAVTTVNNGTTTTVELYVFVSNTDEILYYTPTMNVYDYAVRWVWSPQSSLLTSLPAGTQTSAVYMDSNASSLVVQSSGADSTTALNVKAMGGSEVLRVDTSSKRVVAGALGGTPTAKLQVMAESADVGLRIEKAGSGNALEISDGTDDFLTIDSAGEVLFHNSINSSTAFRIISANDPNGGELFTVDTLNNRVFVGAVGGGHHSTANLYFGDYGAGNVMVGEAYDVDTDALWLNGLNGVFITAQAGEDTLEPMLSLDANEGVIITGNGTNGSAGKLSFGTEGEDSVVISEYGSTNTNGLKLYGASGIYIGAASTDATTQYKFEEQEYLFSYPSVESPTKQYRIRTSGTHIDMDTGGANMYLNAFPNSDFSGTATTGIVVFGSSSRTEYRSSYNLFSPATVTGNVIDVNRTNTGNLIGFMLSGSVKGQVSINGETVGYGTFTGVHSSWTDQKIERGELVHMTGENRHNTVDPVAEPTYGVVRTTTANDPAVLGSYMGIVDPAKPFDSFENAYQIMSVGNGDMWVVDDGQDIKPGDALISSDVAGHAMKDRGQFPTSYVVAHAAQNVTWSQETKMINGRKHVKISVLFNAYQKLNATGLGQGVWNGGIVSKDTKFNAMVTFSGAVKFTGGSTFDSNVAFNKNVTFSDNTAGKATVKAAQKTVVVRFARPHNFRPIVNTTPEQFVNGTYRVKDITKDSFVIELSQTQPVDVQFNWTAIEAAGAN